MIFPTVKYEKYGSKTQYDVFYTNTILIQTRINKAGPALVISKPSMNPDGIARLDMAAKQNLGEQRAGMRGRKWEMKEKK